MKRILTSTLVGLMVVLAGAVFAAPAQAAACAPGNGVTVVIDFTAIPGVGKGVETACVPDGGGKSARAIVTAAGYTFRDAQRFPGFVCRINDVPTTDPCVNASPADAYWGLFWSNGTDGKWIYSSLGVNGLTVPNGGTVGWNWQGNNSRTNPRATPPMQSAPAAAPAPAAKASPGNASKRPKAPARATPKPASPVPTVNAHTAPASPAPVSMAPPSAPPTAAPTPASTPVPVASPSVTPSAEAQAAVTPKSDLSGPEAESSTLPTWVPIVVLIALAAAAATAVVVRHRRT